LSAAAVRVALATTGSPALLAALPAPAETVLTQISRVRLRTLVEQKVPQATLIDRMHRDPNAYLSTILTFNTVANIVASSAATLLALRLYRERVAERLVSLLL